MFLDTPVQKALLILSAARRRGSITDDKVAELQEHVRAMQSEIRRLEATIEAVWDVTGKPWRNEDGRLFVFEDDIRRALEARDRQPAAETTGV